MALWIIRGAFNQLLPAGTAVLTGVSPATLARGQTVTVGISGSNTNFAGGVSQVLAGPGVTVGTVSVVSSSYLTVQLAIAANALLGRHTLLVTTGGQEAVLPNGLTIAQAPYAGPPQFANPGFESGTAGWVGPYWSGTTGGVSSEHVSGTSSVWVDSAEGGYFQDIRGALVSGQAYRVTAWVKTDPGKSVPARIWVHDNLDGAPNSPVNTSNSLTATGSWQLLSLDFVGGNGDLRVHLHRATASASAGRVYWDDVTINPI